MGTVLPNLKKVLVEFVARLPFYGAVAICTDDLEARALIPNVDPAGYHLRY